MIKNLTNGYLGCDRYSSYDYDGLSLQELLCQFFDAINNCVDDVNEYTKIVNDMIKWIKEQGIKDEVIKSIEKMKASGEFDQIIKDKIFTEFNRRLDTMEHEVAHNTEKVNQMDVKVDLKINASETKVNTELQKAKDYVNSRTMEFKTTPFRPGTDLGGSGISAAAYRIPFMTVCKSGTIVAGCDIRYNNSNDHSSISLGTCRSEDGGRSWKDYKVAIEKPNTNPTYSRVMDGTILYDERQGSMGRLWLLGNQWKTATTGWTSSTNKKDNDWDVLLYYSDDEGKNWTKLKSLRDVADQSSDGDISEFIGGVGAGIVSGGKLIFPVQISYVTKSPAAKAVRSAFIYSSNNGQDWTLSKPLPAWSSECSIYEEDGFLKMNARIDGANTRIIYKTNNLGATWTLDEAQDGTFLNKNTTGAAGCQGTTIVAKELGMTLWTQPVNIVNYDRRDISVYVKDKTGVAFNKAYTIKEGGGLGYSTLAYDKWNNKLYVIYEDDGYNVSFKDLTSAIPAIKTCEHRIDIPKDLLYDGNLTVKVNATEGEDVHRYSNNSSYKYKTIGFAIKDIRTRPEYKHIKKLIINIEGNFTESLTIANLPFFLEISGQTSSARSQIGGLYLINTKARITHTVIKKHSGLNYPVALEKNSHLDLFNTDISMADVAEQKAVFQINEDSSIRMDTVYITGDAGNNKDIFNVLYRANIVADKCKVAVQNLRYMINNTNQSKIDFEINSSPATQDNLLDTFDFGYFTTYNINLSTKKEFVINMTDEGKEIFQGSGGGSQKINAIVCNGFVTLKDTTLRTSSGGLSSTHNGKILFRLPKALIPSAVYKDLVQMSVLNMTGESQKLYIPEIFLYGNSDGSKKGEIRLNYPNGTVEANYNLRYGKTYRLW